MKFQVFNENYESVWCTPKLFDRLNYESKCENNERIKSCGMLLSF